MSVMSELQIAKAQLLKAQRQHEAALLSAKTYRGVPYERVTNGKSVKRSLIYRGIPYNFS
jgi:hypothetical protein